MCVWCGGEGRVPSSLWAKQPWGILVGERGGGDDGNWRVSGGGGTVCGDTLLIGSR
jgi:hypothetical protein